MFPGGKGGLCVGLTTLAPSCDDCLEMWEHQLPGTFRTCTRIALPLPCIIFKCNGSSHTAHDCQNRRYHNCITNNGLLFL